ncbi:hypothetical protein [Psychrobacter sp. I-STPA6b]|uniref:hypothetical protein n=1 Tax=Psychrobacter sp. I-STPA6b TaxID=2585718 RepID=UPI001D0CD892|nr:hypothetical protein [Psychrobacter sp. I-STPA6b]
MNQKAVQTLLGILVLALPISAVAQYQTYVIDTYGGASLVPSVRQQLNDVSAGGSVSVYQDKLVLRTTPAGYQAVQQLLRQIDTAPQPVLVAVRVGTTTNSTNNLSQGQVYINQSGIAVNGQFANQQSSAQQNSLYQVQTLSGKPASISTSTLLALAQPSQSLLYTQNRVGYHQPQIQIRIQNQPLVTIDQGISVVPKILANGQAEVSILQSQASLTGKTNVPVQTQQLNTQIIVPRGQWVTIGEVVQNTQGGSNSSQYGLSNQQPIQIKID